MYSHSGPYDVWHLQYLREHCAGASSHTFPTYSTGGVQCNKSHGEVYCLRLPCLLIQHTHTHSFCILVIVAGPSEAVVTSLFGTIFRFSSTAMTILLWLLVALLIISFFVTIVLVQCQRRRSRDKTGIVQTHVLGPEFLNMGIDYDQALNK